MALIAYLTTIRFDHGAVRLLADEFHAVSRPAVLRFNAGQVGDKYGRLAAAMGRLAGIVPRMVGAAEYQALFAAAMG